MSNIDLNNKIVMVTGAAGFIGSHLVTELLRKGVKKVYALDNLKYGNESSLPGDNRIEFIKFDLGFDNIEELRNLFKDVNYLFHLAAEKHNQSKDSPRKVFQSNIVGMHDVCSLAAESGVSKIIFTSSLYAYGRMDYPAYQEDELPAPNTIYGISKLTGENLLQYFNKKYGTSYTILRYLFVYGPKQFSGTGYKSVIIKNFERLARNEKPIIFGDGTQSLDYIYIDDVIELTIHALQDCVNGEIINIGSGSDVSIVELTKLMLDVSQGNSSVEFGPEDFTKNTHRVADTNKMFKLFDYRPKVSLETGLKNTYNWIINNE